MRVVIVRGHSSSAGREGVFGLGELSGMMQGKGKGGI